MFEKIILLVTTVANFVGSPSGQLQGEYSKPLAEYRCVSNLKILGSDKSEFKSWNDKFVNAMAQSLGKSWRKFMKNLNQTLDKERKVLTTDELNAITGASEIENAEVASEGIY